MQNLLQFQLDVPAKIQKLPIGQKTQILFQHVNRLSYGSEFGMNVIDHDLVQ